MPEESHSAEPPRPRRFGDQFYTNPEFFLNKDADAWLDEPLKTITDATMVGVITDQILVHGAETARVRPDLVEDMGFPSQEELTTSVGAEVLTQMTEMIPIVVDTAIQSHPEGREAGLWAAKEARDAGMQGGSEWWAGSVSGGGGGGHAPREDLETGWNPIVPDPVHLRGGGTEARRFNPDPHIINTDTNLEGHLENIMKYGMPGRGGSAGEFVDKMMSPISDLDLNPDDFTDDG